MSALLVAILFSATAHGFETEVNRMLKARQDCELHAARHQYDVALQDWPQCYFAFEGKAVDAEKSGDLRQAIEYLLLAKHNAPNDRWPHLNFHLGRLHFEIKDYERAELYLKVAKGQGAFPVQTNYMLGYLHYRQQEYIDAESCFVDAMYAAQSGGAWEEDKEFLQALHYYLGEIYTRLGFRRHAVQHLWAAEAGQSIEVRRTAWRIHGIHNNGFLLPSFGFGVFHRYDSNVALFSDGQVSTWEIPTGPGGHALQLVWDGKLETSPGRKWSAGVEGVASWNYQLKKLLKNLDELRLSPSAWVRYWQLTNWRVTGRYDVQRTGYKRLEYLPYEWVHGPGVEGEWFVGRATLSARYSLLLKSYPEETLVLPENDRNGYAHVLYLRGALDGPSPWFRPEFEYRLTANWANGENFRYLGHALDALNHFRLFYRTEALFGLGGEVRSFDGAWQRQDQVLRLRGGIRSKIAGPFTVTCDLNYGKNFSNVNLYRYDRFEVMTGAVFRID